LLFEKIGEVFPICVGASRSFGSKLDEVYQSTPWDPRDAKYIELGAECDKAGIPRRRHKNRHGHPRRLQREDRLEDIGVSGDFPVQLATGITPRAGHARGSSPTCPTRAIFLVRILARMSVRDARVYMCTRVLYKISYRVHVYKITR